MMRKLLIAIFSGILIISAQLVVYAQEQGQEGDQTFEGFNLQGYDDEGEKAWDVVGDTAEIKGSEVSINNINANAKASGQTPQVHDALFFIRNTKRSLTMKSG